MRNRLSTINLKLEKKSQNETEVFFLGITYGKDIRSL